MLINYINYSKIKNKMSLILPIMIIKMMMNYHQNDNNNNNYDINYKLNKISI